MQVLISSLNLNINLKSPLRFFCLLFLLSWISACQFHSNSPPVIPPQLDTQFLDSFVEALVANKRAIGASLLIYRDNKEIYYKDAGLAEIENKKEWRRDTLCQIFSMTKPVTGVVLMSLYEDGLFELEDPVSLYLPEFRQATVLTGLDKNGEFIVEPAKREITIRDLMRHTSGITYDWQDNDIAKKIVELDVFNSQKPLREMSEELASLPLLFHPGTRWHYSASVDILARLAEVLTNKPYHDILEERILQPLNMQNTHYNLDPNDESRLALVYKQTPEGVFEKNISDILKTSLAGEIAQHNGGHGLISTIDDYMTFVQMLQNLGSLRETQILKPETVKLMFTSQLGEEVKDFGWLKKGETEFGLNVALSLSASPNPDEAIYTSDVNEVSWGGAASTLFWLNPIDKTSVVFFVQKLPFDDEMHKNLRKTVYQALQN